MKDPSPTRIFLDHGATTPLDPMVRDAMLPWLDCGNPSSLYEEGRRARQAIDQARERVSSAIGCLFAEILFTSSGTESANLAIIGAALANRDATRTRILLGSAEHHCVLNTAPLLERLGYRVELIPVDRIARVRLDLLSKMVKDDVLLVSVLHANNELGTLQPVREVADAAHRVGALYFCDAVQNGLSFGIAEFQPDLLSLSGHKIYGPKGAAALYVKAGTKLAPISFGGAQEREVRAGTENVAGIVGLGVAISSYGDSNLTAITDARNAFLDRLKESGFVPTVPDRDDTLEGHAHVRLPGVDAETMLIRLDRLGVSASSGAACSSGSLEPSHVLLACGYSDREAREGLRFTFGRESNLDEAEEAARRVLAAAASMNRG